MTDIERLIQERWADEQAPLIDGILFDDGRMLTFAYDVVHHGGARGLAVSIDGETDLATFLEEDPEMWTSVEASASVDWEPGGLTIRGGDGGFGSDGFVAATAGPEHRLVWLVFSQKSNPFRRLTIQDDTVVATTELGQVWRIPLPRPESVTVGWP